MNIDLPDPMKADVGERVAGGAYGSVSEYVRDLRRTADYLEEEGVYALQPSGSQRGGASTTCHKVQAAA